MEKKKCLFKEHSEIDAICFCLECNIYMCNKCEKFHSGLFQNHHKYILEKDINEIFTGHCKETNHNDELNFFCKEHNTLCCAKCIIKIKRNGMGQHNDCEVFNIEDIKEDKKNKLKENISKLEEILKTLEVSLNNIKFKFKEINEKKEEIKLKIQKVFTKIRNELNNREDEILLEVDKYFLDDNIIRDNEKLPNKIKKLLEKGRSINEEWNKESNLILLINNCINIENDFKNISSIEENLKKFNMKEKIDIKFYPENDEEINNFLEKIRQIRILSYKYKFRKCPENIKDERKYEISGEYDNIISKIKFTAYYSGTICVNELEKNCINKWKIKILKTENYDIYIGIASEDFDFNSPLPNKNNCSWYFKCKDGCLYSGPPSNLKWFNSNLKKKGNEIIVIMDMNKGTLKFIIDNEEKGNAFENIQTDKPLFPSVLLMNGDDSIQITEC